MRIERRLAVHAICAVSSFLLPGSPSVLPGTGGYSRALAAEPSAAAVLVAKKAFQAYDDRQLTVAEELFSQTIAEWRRLDRGIEELTALLVARAGVRVDSTQFSMAKSDLDEGALAKGCPYAERTICLA